MRMSVKGLALLKEFEGCVLRSYKCPAGIWTIGYGSTGPHVKADMLISKAEAEALLIEDLDRFEIGVMNALRGIKPLQEEFDAMVSLAFNVGLANFKKSSVLRLYKAGKKAEAANAFGMWNKARVNGKLTVLRGLTRRRAAEKELFLSAGAKPTVERPQSVKKAVSVPEESVVPEAPKSLARSKEVIIGSGLSAGGVIQTIDALTVNDLAATKTELQEVSTNLDEGIWEKLHVPEIATALVAVVGVFMIVKRFRDRNKGIR